MSTFVLLIGFPSYPPNPHPQKHPTHRVNQGEVTSLQFTVASNTKTQKSPPEGELKNGIIFRRENNNLLV